MPAISSFYGIVIYMYFLGKEHNPSHIHAYYGTNNAIISIKTGKIIDGRLPRNALKLIKRWLKIHREELETMWDSQVFKKVAPLE